MDLSKRCSTCHLVRDLADFNVRRSAPDGRQARCRECARAWYLQNRSSHIANVGARNIRVKKEHQQRVGRYLLDHPCVDCGESDIRVLEFDHEDPSLKLGTVGVLMGWALGWERIEAEIAKCSVRCANCHRRRTGEMQGSWREAVHRESVWTGAADRLAALFPTSA